jgi:prefoldin subunit 5
MKDSVKIKELEERLEELQEEKEDLENGEDELQAEYKDFIDEYNEEISIFNLKYLASKVLEEVDPIAYRCGYSDFISSRIDDLDYEISSFQDELNELNELEEDSKNT